MEKVINLVIPHVGELIFESIDTPGLIQCLEVSQTWKALAKNVLIKRWEGKMLKACQNGETKVVQLLLEHFNSEESGLNINEDDEFGNTPFMSIAYCVSIIKSIMNIELNARDNNGGTAFMWACRNGHKDIVQLLLDHHSDPNIDLNAKDNFGCTAFMNACKNGYKDVVKLLLDHSKRIDLNARNNHGETALMIACKNGYNDVVELLLNHSERIELNARDNFGWTALMLASIHEQEDVLQLLQDHSDTRIDSNAGNDNGALMIASQRGHQDIVHLQESKFFSCLIL